MNTENALELKTTVDALQIIDTATFEAMQSYKGTAHANIKAIKEHMKPQIDDAHAKHKKLTTLLKEKISPFEDIKADCHGKLVKFQDEQAKIKREAFLKAKREAEEKAEAEQIKKAAAMEKLGKTEQAEEIINAPIKVVIEQPDIETPTVKGGREIYTPIIMDVVLLCRAIGDGSCKVNVTENNLPKLASILGLGKLASAQGINMDVPGVVVQSKTV